MKTGRVVPAWMQRFARDEQGFITVQNLFLTISCCAIGAIGLDVTSFYAARTHLQVAADTGAHAALYTRHRGRTEDEAKTAALGVATFGVPNSHGTVLDRSQIAFGTWNESVAPANAFTALPAGSTALPSAVRVTTARADDNAVGSFLFRIVGVDEMDVSATAVYKIYYAPCLSEGFVAEGVVDIQSNNSFFNSFCIHSNTRAEINNGNFFDAGTRISAPGAISYYENKPDSVFTNNNGFREALRDGTENLSILDKLRDNVELPEGERSFMEQISTRGYADSPWFLTAPDPAPKTQGGSFAVGDLTKGAVNRISCGNSGSSSSGSRSSRAPVGASDLVLMGAKDGTGKGGTGGGGTGGGGTGGNSNQLTLTGGTYSQMVIITDCLVNFSGKVNLEDVILYTTNTSDNSITASSGNSNGLVLGKDDNCDPRGGATILTRGGMHASAQMLMFGSQVRLLGSFAFASGGNGGTDGVTGEGVSVIAGGRIDGTTHMNISSCDKGMDRDFEIERFALAR